MKKKALSLFLALTMCLSMMPTVAFAAENTSGGGTQEYKTEAAENSIAVRAAHSHPICGESCADDQHHTNVTWTGVSDVTGLKEGGYYYLIKNVTVSETWHPEDGVTLCLNGYKITASKKGMTVIDVEENKTFTLTDSTGKGEITHKYETSGNFGRGVIVNGIFNMYGGNITDNRTSANYEDNRLTYGAGVYVTTGSTFNMYGGKITSNCSYSGGGGVYVDYTYSDKCRTQFNMYGGEISGNSCIYGSSGGVSVNGGEFTMSGGSITGNADYGVFIADYRNNVGNTYPATFTVSGTVNITGNTKSSTASRDIASNVYLPTGKTITIDGTLSSDSRIGITTQDEASATIATGAADMDMDIFSSDVMDKGYSFTKETDGTLKFNGHDHQWTYTPGDQYTNYIYARCTAEYCPLDKDNVGYGDGGNIRLSASNTYSYNGQSHAAWLEYSSSSSWPGDKVTDKDISYENTETGENLGTTAPVASGTYKASITANGVTAYRTFTITKSTPTIRSWGSYPSSNKYTGLPVSKPTKDQLTIQVNYNNVDLYDTITFKWYKAIKGASSNYTDYQKGDELSGAPTDAGDYYIEAVFAETGNTEAATVGTGFTIGQMDPQVINAPAYNVYLNRAADYTIDLNSYLSNLNLGSNVTYELQTDLQNYFISTSSTVSDDGKLSISMNAVNPSGSTNPIGTMQIWVKSSNYQWITLNVPINLISKNTRDDIDVTMDSWTYGDEPKAPQYEASVGDTVTYKKTDGTVLSGKPTDAGDYTVTVSRETDTEIHTGSASFTIAKRKIDLPTVTEKVYAYNGTAQTYDISADTTYVTISNDPQTNAGKYTVTAALKDKNNTQWGDGKTDDKTYSFIIAPKPLSEVTIGDFNDITYTGEAIQPSVIPVDGNTALKIDTDYTVSYGENTNVGEATITITGKGNYTGVVNKRFHILQADDPDYKVPENLTATYGQTLAQVSLTNGWTWNDPTQSVGNVTGDITSTFKATYTPTNTNYKTVPDVDVAVKVNKAAGGNLGSVGYDRRFTNGDSDSITLSCWNDLPSGQTWSYSSSVRDEDAGKLSKHDFTTDGKTLTYALNTENVKPGDSIVFTVKASCSNYDDFTYTITVKVTDRNQQAIQFDGGLTEKTVTYGDENFTVKAVTMAKTQITYSSSNTNVAEVNENTGEVAIKGAGETTITASAAQTDDYTSASLSYKLIVTKKLIIITAKDKTSYVGDAVPKLPEPEKEVEGTDYTVTGLVGKDSLTKVPALKYTDADGKDITPDMTKAGEFIISTSDADAGSNYDIRYVNGKLTVSVRHSSSGGGSVTYPVNTPNKTDNGGVSVDIKNAKKGSTVTVTVKPDAGYELDKLTVTDKDGKELKLTDKGDGKYTFTMLAGKVDVKASFTKTVETSPFADVSTGAYYYDAVKWAAEKGITGGTGSGSFAPASDCTRAQIVTFLWRAAGSPEPKALSIFSDIASGSYYAKAVAWAIENGITNGTTNTTFSPDAICSRAQAVTFLSRALNAQASGTSQFRDVSADSYYANAVAWAVTNGVTNGIGNGLFGPDNSCTRSQIVAFLYRAYFAK